MSLTPEVWAYVVEMFEPVSIKWGARPPSEWLLIDFTSYHATYGEGVVCEASPNWAAPSTRSSLEVGCCLWFGHDGPHIAASRSYWDEHGKFVIVGLRRETPPWWPHNPSGLRPLPVAERGEVVPSWDNLLKTGADQHKHA